MSFFDPDNRNGSTLEDLALLILLLVASLVIAKCEPAPRLEHELALAIASQEGWYFPGSPLRPIHNPGALVFAGQPGATRTPQGYAAWKTDAEGWRALERDDQAKLAGAKCLVDACRVEYVLRARAGADTPVELYVDLILTRLRSRKVIP